MSGRSCALSVLVLAVVAGGGRLAAAEAAPKKGAAKPKPEAVIRRALTLPVDLEFVETPLPDCLEYLDDKLGIQTRLDRRALDEVGIPLDAPVTLKVSGISARSALDLMLRQIGLQWVIRYELLWVTTVEEAHVMLETRVYDVADLVTVGEEADPFSDDAPDGSVCDFDSLIDLTTSCVAPTTWDDVGGPGSIQPFEAPGIRAIVLAQTQQVHEDVERLLADLRRVRCSRESPQADRK